jgi:hypothetical protein
VPVSGGGFDWLGFLIFVTILIWGLAQLLPARRAKWRSRRDAAAPIVSLIAGDARAVFVRPIEIRWQAWKFRQDLDRGESG